VILAIDSSAGTSVAIVDSDGKSVAEASSSNPRGHAEVIGALISQVLESAGVEARQLEAVVMGVGPGPFTGLRVGMAAAAAVAWAHSLPLWPVVSMDAAAWGLAGRVVVWSDQKRRERAWAVYSHDDGLPVAEALPVLHPAADFSEIEQRYPGCDVREATTVNAAHLARVALERKRRGLEFVGPQALYLRPPDVTLAP
jgi:tRNA threonylcarbamoyl adenosine modification protein YeaZ